MLSHINQEDAMRTRRHPSFAAAADAPISALNTTPLIDVMLVLLIMFIVTIPLMTHSVKIDIPQGPVTEIPKEPETHRLHMDPASRLYWDGAPIAEAALRERLAEFRTRDPEGHLLFQIEAETRYEDFDRILADVKRAGIERLGFVGNEGHAAALSR
jgi:biopolymer transport protein ExbD